MLCVCLVFVHRVENVSVYQWKKQGLCDALFHWQRKLLPEGLKIKRDILLSPTASRCPPPQSVSIVSFPVSLSTHTHTFSANAKKNHLM